MERVKHGLLWLVGALYATNIGLILGGETLGHWGQLAMCVGATILAVIAQTTYRRTRKLSARLQTKEFVIDSLRKRLEFARRGDRIPTTFPKTGDGEVGPAHRVAPTFIPVQRDKGD